MSVYSGTEKQVDWQSKDLTEKTKELYSTRQEQVCVSIQWYRDQLQKQVDWQSKDLTDKTKELYSTRQEQVCVSIQWYRETS